MGNKKKEGLMGIISLGLGILALIICWVPVCGFIVSLTAIVVSIVALKTAAKKGFAIAGLVLGILALILSVVVFFSFFIFQYLRQFSQPPIT